MNIESYKNFFSVSEGEYGNFLRKRKKYQRGSSGTDQFGINAEVPRRETTQRGNYSQGRENDSTDSLREIGVKSGKFGERTEMVKST